MNGTSDAGSDDTIGEVRPVSLPETGVHPKEVGEATSGETVQLAPRSRTTVELPTVPESHYDRENEIARGGMGRIVAAWDRRLGRAIAIKELIHSTDDGRRRFEREAVVTARLQHPAIINVHDAGRWPSGEPFFVMKRVEGESLADVIHKTRSLNERLALLPNLISIVEAMAYAHGQNVIHRDLKPANVLLGSFGETVVIDWGLAKDLSAGPDGSGAIPRDVVVQDGLTVVGTIMGTPAYMPPEQARGAAVDQRADVYALGAILYYLLAGEPPYTGQSSADVLKRVLDSAPKELGERQSGIPPDLLTIVRKAMAREASDRYPTAKELAEDLKRFQTGQLVGAHAYSPRELAARWIARHRAPASITVVAALVLVTTGVLSVQRIARERNDAQAARREAEGRNDQLVLNQARSSLRDDPTAAIAWLKNYSLDGPAWGAARIIAADARSQGVAARVLAGHEHHVNRVAFSPDGRLLASGGQDKTVRLWDLASGTSRVLKGHDWFVHALAFSADGQWLASVGGKMLWLWNVATGEGRSVRGGFLDRDIAFSPDGRSLVALAEDDDGLIVHLWDPQTGFTRVIRDPADKGSRYEIGYSDDYRLAISPDGATVFGQTGHAALRMWDLKAGKRRIVPNQRTFALSADGQLLATVSTADNAVRVRDLATDRERILFGPSGAIPALSFSPDGRWIASASEDSLVRLGNVSTGLVRILKGHSGEVHRVVFSPDSRTLASASEDRTVRLWDVASGDVQTLRGHLESVTTIAFSPDGRTLASASRDRTIRLWRVGANDHRVLFRPDTVPEQLARRIAVGPHGLLAATWDRASIHVWDLESGAHRVLNGHDGAVLLQPERSPGIRQMVFSSDGKALASASSDKTVRLWNLTTGESRTFAGHGSVVDDVAFSPNGAQLASVGWDKTVRLWDIATGTGRVLSGHENPLTHVAFSPDSRSIVSSGLTVKRDAGQQDLTVRVWDATTGEGRELHGHEDSVTDARFSADGKTIVSASMDTTVRLWDAVTGRVQRVLKGDGSMVSRLALSRDGHWLASENEGGMTRLWNLVTGRSDLLLGRESTFSEDGTTLASSASFNDGVARLWDTATGEGRVLSDAYSNVAISPDGQLVAAIGKDGAIHPWNDDLPRDPVALKAWLQKATDYRVSAGSPKSTPEPDRP